MAATKKSKTSRNKPKTPKKKPTWGEPCGNRVRGVLCGGTIISNGNYEHLRPLPDGAPDYRFQVRVWKCQRCGKKWHKDNFRILYDPDSRQPMVSEYSQKASRNPYDTFF